MKVNKLMTFAALGLLLVVVLPPTQKAVGQPVSRLSVWSGFDTRDAQSALRDLGYDPGPIDGFPGPLTDVAVRAFQRDQGIASTGLIDAKTKLALAYAILMKAAKEESLEKPCSDMDATALDIHKAFVDFAARHKWEVGRIYDYRALMREHYESSPDPFLSNLIRWIGYRPANRSALPGLLVYDHDGSNLRAWLITADGLRAYHDLVIDISSLHGAVYQLRRALAIDSRQALRSPKRRGVRVATDFEQNSRLAMEEAIALLSKLLFPQSCRDEFRSISHLIIIPTSVLWTVPFAVLQPFDRGSYLIDNMTLAMAPSLIDLTSDYGLWRYVSRRKKALVVGNPSFPNADDDWSFPPLPGAESEAKAVADRLGVAALIGGLATKAAVVEHSKSADVLYFATHSIANSQDPLNSSFLLLAGQPGADSRWTLDEIQRTRFVASLAVLSACQTGLGQVFDAGILGLARGFHISGVPRIAISLWQVDDDATRDLMVAFMDRIIAGDLYPPEALRAAMLETREKYPDPSEWASFTMFGALW